jgi:hypothetical protein
VDAIRLSRTARVRRKRCVIVNTARHSEPDSAGYSLLLSLGASEGRLSGPSSHEVNGSGPRILPEWGDRGTPPMDQGPLGGQARAY